MHLVFSTSDYTNSDISNEQGHILYSVSTPRASKRITTITKYRWSGPNSVSETMATVEWHELKGTLIRFNGNEIKADVMLGKRRWNTGRYFVGPDKRSYKWKLESTHCWMKLAESDVALARFHKKNFGIRKQSHPPYLDVSPTVVPMLDHVILTGHMKCRRFGEPDDYVLARRRRVEWHYDSIHVRFGKWGHQEMPIDVI